MSLPRLIDVSRPHLTRPRAGGDAAPGAPGRAELGTDVVRSLRELARGADSDVRWDRDGDIAAARNAHRTNSIPELRAALAGPSTWLEGDVRARSGRAVMAHDARRRDAELSLRDWIAIGAASGRGLKLDVKDASVIDDALRMLRAADVPAHRVLFNVAASGADRSRSRASIDQLRRIRAAYPSAIINLDPGAPPYDAACIARVVQVAKAVGGRIMFPLDAKAVTPAAVRELRRVGRVAVWNDPRTFDPGDIAATTRRLRSMGVNGMVDLRPAAARGRDLGRG